MGSMDVPLSTCWGKGRTVPGRGGRAVRATGHLFHGYERITRTESHYHDTDLSFRRPQKERVTGFLQCESRRIFPNPGCTLDEQSPVLYYGFQH